MATQLKIAPQPESLKRKLKARLLELQQERAVPEEVWQMIADYVIPRLWDIVGTATSQGGSSADKHKKYGSNCYDGSPMGMLTLLADGLHGYLVSPAIRWFRLRMGQPNMQAMRNPAMARYMKNRQRLDELPEIKAYLESCEEIMYSTYDNSNFYDAMAEYFLHGGSIGTATMWPEWDYMEGKPVFTVLHPKEIFISEDSYGRVDTLYRRYRMTARQILQRCALEDKQKGIPTMWDPTKLTDQIINCINHNKMDSEFNVIHAIFPRSDRNIKMPGGKNKPWASIHFLEEGGDDDDTILNEWGFSRFPACCWRWKKDTGRKYGASPAWDALVDILGLNTMSRTMLTIAHKAADPPIMAPADMRGQLRLAAKGINYYSDPRNKIEPVEVGRNYPIAMDSLERKEKIIQEHFKVDFFLLLTRAEKTMTATEIIEKQGEKAAVLGSTIGRLNNEALNPITDIIFDMLGEARMLPPPPQVLVDYMALSGQGKIDVVYLGPLAQAQRRLFTSQGVTRSLEMAMPIFQMIPDTMAKVNWYEVIDQIFEAGGMPANCIVDDDEIERIKEEKARMIEEEKTKENLERTAETMKKVGAANRGFDGAITEALKGMSAEQMQQLSGGMQGAVPRV